MSKMDQMNGAANMTHMPSGEHDHAAHDHSSANQGAGAGGTDVHRGMGAAHQMSPFLFTRTTGFFVLFKQADIQSAGAFAGAFALSFAFALLATAASQLLRHLEERALVKGGALRRAVAALHHGLRQLLHYVAMLIVMTMNVWIILAVVVGHAFGWMLYATLLFPHLKRPCAKNDAHC